MVNKTSHLYQKIQSFPITQSTEALNCFLALIAERFDAVNVSWYAGYKGSYGHKSWFETKTDAWKMLDIVSHSDIQFDAYKALNDYYTKCQQHGCMDPHTEHLLEAVGSTRVHLLRDCVNYDEWKKPWMLLAN